MPLCGHPPPSIYAYTNCSKLLAQLTRIAEPEAWATPEARDQIPFDLPDACDPGPNNIWTVYSDDYCGWECRNNAYLIAQTFTAADVGSAVGVHDAYGIEIDHLADFRDGDIKGGRLPAYMPGDENSECEVGHLAHGRQPMVMGMMEASYGPGSERLGIGWRD